MCVLQLRLRVLWSDEIFGATPSSEDHAWRDGPGAYHHSLCRLVSRLSISRRSLGPRTSRSSKWCLVTEVEEARYRSVDAFDSLTDSLLSSFPSLTDRKLFTAAPQDPPTPAQVAIPTIVRKPPPLPSWVDKPPSGRWMFYNMYGVSCA